MEYLDVAQQTTEFARRAGAAEAEAFVQGTRVLTIEVSDGQVETIKQAEDIGLSVRAICDQRLGLAYSTDLSAASLRRAAERAVEIARASEPDIYATLPEPARAVPEVDNYDPELDSHAAGEKVARALDIERAAREHDSRIVMVRRASYIERGYSQAVANSRGVALAQRMNLCGGYAMVVARQGGEQQMGHGSSIQARYAAFDPRAVGVEGAEQAIRLLGATTPITQRVDALLSPKMACAFVSLLANLVRADNVQKKKSLLAGKIGQRVAAPGVTLMDDGAYAGAPGARSWDEEGVPSQRTPLIVDGVLQGYLHTTYTALKAGASSTGNASRASIKVGPDPAPSNLVLLPQQAPVGSPQVNSDALGANASTLRPSPSTLRTRITRGIEVLRLSNLHTANPISGEFSFGAEGLWIENGEVCGSVRGATIAGNLTDLLMNIRGMGDDLTWSSTVAAPTVWIGELSIAGK